MGRLIKNRINKDGNRKLWVRYRRDGNRGKYYLMSKGGNTFVIKNLYRWCRDKGFNHTTIYNTYYNPHYTYKGYKLIYPNYWVSDEVVK